MSTPADQNETGRRIGFMGGTFDPVHNGHLQLAQQVREFCELDQVLMVPVGQPVHRAPARATCAQRIAMLELAVENKAWLQVDTRECDSPAPSYTFDTLTAIRRDRPGIGLFLLMGLDAFLALATWHRWRELFTLAHIVVAARPGYAWDPASADPELRAEIDGRIVYDPKGFGPICSGRILFAALQMPAVSSSQVRDLVKNNCNTADVLPPAVAGYIEAHGLYQQ